MSIITIAIVVSFFLVYCALTHGKHFHNLTKFSANNHVSSVAFVVLFLVHVQMIKFVIIVIKFQND